MTVMSYPTLLQYRWIKSPTDSLKRAFKIMGARKAITLLNLNELYERALIEPINPVLLTKYYPYSFSGDAGMILHYCERNEIKIDLVDEHSEMLAPVVMEDNYNMKVLANEDVLLYCLLMNIPPHCITLKV